MYERPRPVLKPVCAPRTVLSDLQPFSPWTMAPIGQHEAEDALPTETIRAEDIDHDAAHREEQERELLAIREQARQDGYAQGHAEGLSQGTVEGKAQGYAQGYANAQEQARLAQHKACSQLESLFTSAQRDIIDMQEDIGDALVKMGARIASHILSVEVRRPGKSVLAIVRQIFAEHEDSNHHITFYLHSADLKLVQDNCPTAHSCTAILLADPTLSRGDVKAKTKYGDVDATLKTRWEAAMASIGLTEPGPK